MNKLDAMKDKFIRKTMRCPKKIREGSREQKMEWAALVSVNCAVNTRRGLGVYCDTNPKLREKFRNTWKYLLYTKTGRYENSVSDEFHNSRIKRMCALLSHQHQDILHKGKMRVGVLQKGLNLYLKCLWCLRENSWPPHCPLDSVILKKAKLPKAKWTYLNCITKYQKWIKQCAKVAEQHPCVLQNDEIQKEGILSCWELIEYQNSRPRK